MSPNSPKTDKEESMTSTSCVSFNPSIRSTFSKEIMSRKPELKPNGRRETTITQTMQNGFVAFTTTRTGSGGSHMTVMEKG
jgi:hypothetical protein